MFIGWRQPFKFKWNLRFDRTAQTHWDACWRSDEPHCRLWLKGWGSSVWSRGSWDQIWLRVHGLIVIWELLNEIVRKPLSVCGCVLLQLSVTVPVWFLLLCTSLLHFNQQPFCLSSATFGKPTWQLIGLLNPSAMPYQQNYQRLILPLSYAAVWRKRKEVHFLEKLT